MASGGRILADMVRESLQTEGVATSSLSEVFAEEPPPLDVFIRDAKYLNNPALSEAQSEPVRYAEQIYFPELYPAMVEEFGEYWVPKRMVNDIAIAIGKGGGKDHICRMTSARVVHMLLCLNHPQRYYGMPMQDSIHVLNVATSAPQANRAYFAPFSKLVKQAPAFRDRANPLKYTVEFDKGIEAVSGHSDSEGMEGNNIIVGIIDEASAFPRSSAASPASADRTVEAHMELVKSSGRTRFPGVYKRMMISYPRLPRNDIILTEVDKAKRDYEEKGEKSTKLGIGPYATWEAHPLRTREEFAEDYETDPGMAMMKYECIPSASGTVVFRNMDPVERSLFRPNPVEVSYYWDKDLADAPDEFEVPGWEVRFEAPDSFKPVKGCRYAIHGDKAVSGDRAGVAMAHVSGWKDPEDGDEQVPLVEVDFAIYFESNKSASPEPREVQLRWYRQLVAWLRRRGFPVLRATFDGYQSTDSIQQLERWGVETERVSTDLHPLIYEDLRSLAYSGRLRGPDSGLLVTELRELNYVRNKIDHPPGGSKDVSDSVACAVDGAILLGGDPPSHHRPEVIETSGAGGLFEGEGFDGLVGTVGDVLSL